MSTDQKFLLIRNYDLFSHITDEEYEELNLDHHFIEAPKGEYIYFDSKFHNKLYFLKGGTIKIGYIDDEGKEVVKEIIREGEVFGQFTLERDNLNGEFAQAYKGDVSLCAFNIEDFEKQRRGYVRAVQFGHACTAEIAHPNAHRVVLIVAYAPSIAAAITGARFPGYARRVHTGFPVYGQVWSGKAR